MNPRMYLLGCIAIPAASVVAFRDKTRFAKLGTIPRGEFVVVTHKDVATIVGAIE